jgi:hypothetical protein
VAGARRPGPPVRSHRGAASERITGQPQRGAHSPLPAPKIGAITPPALGRFQPAESTADIADVGPGPISGRRVLAGFAATALEKRRAANVSRSHFRRLVQL